LSIASSNVSSAASTANHSTPHVNLLNIPVCKSVKVLAPKDGRELHKRAKAVDNSGPFIFSPFASLSQANKPNNVFDFQWVEGDVCEVILQFENILNIPLQLTNIKLLTEGACKMESWASSVVVESESCTSVTVKGQASCPGELRIIGYIVTALGVTSTCRFKHIPHLKVPFYIMRVVPALPLLQIDTQATDLGNDSLTIDAEAGGGRIKGSMLAGETRDIKISLTNTSSRPVTNCAVVIKSNSNKKSKVFDISESELKAQLPVKGNSSASVTLSLYAFADFLAMTYGEGSEEGGSVASSVLSAPTNSNTGSSFRGGELLTYLAEKLQILNC